MGRVYNNIIETIGRTPLVKLNRITKQVEPNIYVKIEAFNPGASVKDRICMSMIEAAEEANINRFTPKSEEAFKSFTVPPTFMSFERIGSFTESVTLANAAS